MYKWFFNIKASNLVAFDDKSDDKHRKNKRLLFLISVLSYAKLCFRLYEFMLFAHLYCTHVRTPVWGHGTGMWSAEDNWGLVSAKDTHFTVFPEAQKTVPSPLLWGSLSFGHGVSRIHFNVPQGWWLQTLAAPGLPRVPPRPQADVGARHLIIYHGHWLIPCWGKLNICWINLPSSYQKWEVLETKRPSQKTEQPQLWKSRSCEIPASLFLQAKEESVSLYQSWKAKHFWHRLLSKKQFENCVFVLFVFFYFRGRKKTTDVTLNASLSSHSFPWVPAWDLPVFLQYLLTLALILESSEWKSRKWAYHSIQWMETLENGEEGRGETKLKWNSKELKASC